MDMLSYKCLDQSYTGSLAQELTALFGLHNGGHSDWLVSQVIYLLHVWALSS